MPETLTRILNQEHPLYKPATKQKLGEGRLVTVFGGTGFLGRHLVPLLARDGWKVRIAVRHPTQADFLKTAGELGQVSALATDIADSGSVSQALKGSDAAVNLVGILHERGRQSFDLLQAQAPKNMAQAAADFGLEKFVHLSAIGADKASRADYARTKALGEEALKEGFPKATILRPSVIFGPEDSFYNRFANMAKLSPFLPLIGGGKTLLQPVYVNDVAQAIRLSLAESKKHRGKTYELGGPDVWSFKECLLFLMKVMGKRRVLISLPFSLALAQGFFMERLPTPPLTRGQVIMLQRDNVVSDKALASEELGTLEDFGIIPKSMVQIVPRYIKA